MKLAVYKKWRRTATNLHNHCKTQTFEKRSLSVIEIITEFALYKDLDGYHRLWKTSYAPSKQAAKTLKGLRELLVYLEFRLPSRSAMSFYLPCCWDSRKPIESVEFKFVARQVVASVVIRAAKPKFVAESRTRVYFAQHVASTCNTLSCCETSWYKHGNTRNNVFQLAMQQCCKTSWRTMLPVLPDLKQRKWD